MYREYFYDREHTTTYNHQERYSVNQHKPHQSHFPLPEATDLDDFSINGDMSILIEETCFISYKKQKK